MFFFYNPGDRTWQPFLVSYQPILYFLEPCIVVASVKVCHHQLIWYKQWEVHSGCLGKFTQGIPYEAHSQGKV